MTSRLDDRIREMMQRVVDESPPPPGLPTGPPPTPVPEQRVPNWAIAVGAAVAVFVLFGGLAWLVSGTEFTNEPAPADDGFSAVDTSEGTAPATTDAAVTATPTTVSVAPALDELLLTSEDLPVAYRGPRQPIEEEFWDSGILIPFCENGLMVLAEPSLEMLTVGLPAAVAFEGDRAGATQVLYPGTSQVMPVGDAFDDVAHELDECVAEWEQDPAIGFVDEYIDDGWQWVVEQMELNTDGDASYALRYYAVDGDGTNASTPWGMNHAFAMVRTDTHLMLLELRDGLDEGPLDADEYETVLNASLDRLSNANA